MAVLHLGFDARFAGVAQGGVGRYVEEVVKALAKTNEQFLVSLFIRKTNWGLFALDNRFKKVLIDVPWYGWREQIEMPKLFRQARCDVYHIPHFNVPLCMPRPFVCTLHDLIMWERGDERDTTRTHLVSRMKALAMKAVVRHALKNGEVCIVPSQWSAGRIEQVTGVKPKRIEVVHEGAETMSRVQAVEWETVENRFHLQKPYVLTVGNVYRHKNIPSVIDALASLHETFPSLHHVHAGPEHPKEFHEEIVSYGREKLGDRFHHAGNVTDEELAALYCNTSLFIAPSHIEGFALSALEAMSLGAPVIAARAHCFPEILGDAARYAPAGDVHALAYAISELLTDAGERAELGERGRIHAEQYTWEKHASSLMRIYQSIFDGTIKYKRDSH